MPVLANASSEKEKMEWELGYKYKGEDQGVKC